MSDLTAKNRSTEGPTKTADADMPVRTDAESDKRLVCDTKNTHVFAAAGRVDASSVFTQQTQGPKKAAVIFSADTDSVTIAFGDGDSAGKSAVKIAQKLWGPEAEGDDRAAVSPPGVRMNEKELIKAVKAVEAAVEPAKDRRIEERVAELKKCLREKPLAKRIKTAAKTQKVAAYKETGAKGQLSAIVKEEPVDTGRAENGTGEGAAAVGVDTESSGYSAPGKETIDVLDEKDQEEDRELPEEETGPGEAEEITEDEEYRILENRGLVYADDGMSVYVMAKAADILDEDGKMRPEEAEKLRKCIWDISPVEYSEKDGVYRTTNVFIIEPSEEKDTANVYEYKAQRTKEDAAETKKEEEKSAAETEDKKEKSAADRQTDEVMEMYDRAKEFIVKIKEGIAVGAAVAFVISYGAKVKTMEEAKEREALREELRDRVIKVREALGLENNGKAGKDRDTERG